jgi:hypothetical protein
MEVAQVPTQPVDVVEPAADDKGAKLYTQVEADSSNNRVESFDPIERVKTPEAEVVPHAPIEERRPVDLAVTHSTIDGGETHAAVSEPPHSPHTSTSAEGGADFVTPAGTVEAPICSTDTTTAEAAEKEGAAPAQTASETETAVPAVKNEPEKTVEPSVEHKAEHNIEPKIEQHEVVTASPVEAAEAQAAPTTATVAESLVETAVQAPASSPGKKAKQDKKQANVRRTLVTDSPLDVKL